MKFAAFLVPVSILALSLTSCKKEKIFGVIGKGKTVTEYRIVSGFDKISLSVNADVYFVQDSIYSLEVSGQSNVLSVLETDVDDHELEIEFDKRVHKHSKVTIIVHAPSITEFEISGSGKIESQSPVVTNSMRLKISGSGNIYIPTLNTAILEANISGSGNIQIANGTITSERLTVSGSGDIDAVNAIAAHASAKISGSGDISLYATETLDATISGSGNIKYQGTPAVNVNISGSGKVIHL